MYLLDTNIVSELMQEQPSTVVSEWVFGIPTNLIYYSAISEAELRYGAEILPSGKRRDSLITRIDRMLQEAFENRILPFDTLAAKSYASIAGMRRSAGRPISLLDCQIAAIAESRDLTLVTRNTRDFTDVGISLINPWNQFNT
ncbi:MAG: type II toxin-antitoxin system VapC family toxin [Gammaproteobacteria bacterium]|nr:type II toxin-antitoxin system VapC family toxin [Gammaproteobacteria bacterium]